MTDDESDATSKCYGDGCVGTNRLEAYCHQLVDVSNSTLLEKALLCYESGALVC